MFYSFLILAGVPYVLGGQHITAAVKAFRDERAKARQPIPEWMKSVTAEVIKMVCSDMPHFFGVSVCGTHLGAHLVVCTVSMFPALLCEQDATLEVREFLSGDSNGIQWSISKTAFSGIASRSVP